jgi:hypothetical protein
VTINKLLKPHSGPDMTTAINLFLRQTARENDLPFRLSSRPQSVGASTVEINGQGQVPNGSAVLEQVWDGIVHRRVVISLQSQTLRSVHTHAP